MSTCAATYFLGSGGGNFRLNNLNRKGKVDYLVDQVTRCMWPCGHPWPSGPLTNPTARSPPPNQRTTVVHDSLCPYPLERERERRDIERAPCCLAHHHRRPPQPRADRSLASSPTSSCRLPPWPSSPCPPPQVSEEASALASRGTGAPRWPARAPSARCCRHGRRRLGGAARRGPPGPARR